MKKIGKISPFFVYLISPLSSFGETFFTISLPYIAKDFDNHVGLIQFSNVLFYCGFSLGILTLGMISDIVGRKPVFVSGILLYSVFSLTISYSKTMLYFSIFRFFQAYSISVCSVVGQAMIRDSYQKRSLSYMYITMSISIALLPALGNVLGGYLLEYFTWQVTFKFVSCVVLFLFLVFLLFLPETNAFPSTLKQQKIYLIFQVIIKDKIFLLNALIVGAFNGVLYGFFIQAPFLFIEDIKLSSSSYSKLLLLMNISTLLGNMISIYLIYKKIRRSDIKQLGLNISIIGCTLLYIASIFLNAHLHNSFLVVIAVFIPMMIHVIGHSLLIPMILSAALKKYNKSLGIAGSIFGASYYLVTAIIILIIAVIHETSIEKYSILCIICMLLSSIAIAYINRNKKSST